MRFFRVTGSSCSTRIIKIYTPLSGYLSPWSIFHVHLSMTLALKKCCPTKNNNISPAPLSKKNYMTFPPHPTLTYASLNGTELFWDNSKTFLNILHKGHSTTNNRGKKVSSNQFLIPVSAPTLTPWKYFYHIYA